MKSGPTSVLAIPTMVVQGRKVEQLELSTMHLSTVPYFSLWFWAWNPSHNEDDAVPMISYGGPGVHTPESMVLTLTNVIYAVPFPSLRRDDDGTVANNPLLLRLHSRFCTIVSAALQSLLTCSGAPGQKWQPRPDANGHPSLDASLLMLFDQWLVDSSVNIPSSIILLTTP